jgi:hypothetical protein
LRLDAVPPATLAPRPGHRGPAGAARVVADKVAPLEWAVRDDAPPRVNLLLPTIDLDHLFGGYIAKFNLARRLAERGARVRLVTVDPTPPLPPAWRAQVEAYEGLRGVFDRVEVAFGRESPGGIEVSRDDRFVATTWWSAHVAEDARRRLGLERFLYLIQEYEPFTFPMSTWGALAEQSYRFPHVALFSTELLRGFFRREQLGVFGGPDGEEASLAFANAITPVAAPDAATLATRTSRRLLFYARPEPHAARNLFELGSSPSGAPPPTGRSATAGSCAASARRRSAGGCRSAAAPSSSCCRAPPRASTRSCWPSTTSGSRSCTRRTRRSCRSRWPRPAC